MAKRKTRRERRTFTDEYKQQVLGLVRERDKSIAQICRELDLTQSTVHKWVQAEKEANGTMAQSSLVETDAQELQRLRAENKQLKTERDILKKATVGSIPQRNSYHKLKYCCEKVNEETIRAG